MSVVRKVEASAPAVEGGEFKLTTDDGGDTVVIQAPIKFSLHPPKATLDELLATLQELRRAAKGDG